VGAISRRVIRVGICALVASAPAFLVIGLTGHNKITFVVGFLLSVLLFFIVLLVEFYGMGFASAARRVCLFYLEMALYSIPFFGQAVEFGVDAHERSKRKPPPTVVEESPEEARRFRLAWWWGGGVGVGGGFILTLVAALQSGEKVSDAIMYSVLGASGGFMVGSIYGQAISELLRSTVARRMIGSQGLYGAIYGTLFGIALLRPIGGGPLGFLVSAAVWFTIGVTAGWIGFGVRPDNAA
jgi:hypothetical protein